MLKYIIRRLMITIPTLLGISMLIFLIINLAPGNPLSNLVDPRIDPRDMERMLDELRLNDPLPLRYVTWLKETVQGNLGYSARFKRPVTDLIKTRIGPTLLLTMTSMLLSFLIAIPVGVLSATRQYSKLDYLSSVLAIAGVLIPVFFLGVVVIKVFSLDLGWFPVGGMLTAGKRHIDQLSYYRDVLWHMTLPMLVLSAAGVATFMRFTRSSMLEVIRQDYIRTARAKGLSEKVVIYKHALRNALIPVVTMLGLSFPLLFSGTVITETVFTWPGMGTLNLMAVENRDYPLLMGINLFLAMLVLLGNLFADILYSLVDPRIRYD